MLRGRECHLPLEQHAREQTATSGSTEADSRQILGYLEGSAPTYKPQDTGLAKGECLEMSTFLVNVFIRPLIFRSGASFLISDTLRKLFGSNTEQQQQQQQQQQQPRKRRQAVTGSAERGGQADTPRRDGGSGEMPNDVATNTTIAAKFSTANRSVADPIPRHRSGTNSGIGIFIIKAANRSEGCSAPPTVWPVTEPNPDLQSYSALLKK